MDDKDKKRFSDLMLGMADNFRDSISKEGLMLRFTMLKRFTIDQIECAGANIMEHRKYTKMPPIAEFIEAIEGNRIQPDQLADEQWETVILGLINHIDMPIMTDNGMVEPYDPTENIKDPITKRLAKTRFTVSRMKQSLTKEMPFIRKEFIEAYVSSSNINKQITSDICLKITV